jgi:hypothetical protein
MSPMKNGVSSFLGEDFYIYRCRGNLRVLVPGAGLGRLAFDVANLGLEALSVQRSMRLKIRA